MGLATSFSIIREHFGLLEATSSVGGGSTFVIHLPALGGNPDDDTKVSRRKDIKGEYILLMDDDELLLNAISRLLKNLGYRIDTADDGMKAVARYHMQLEKGEKYDAVILDITVPGGMGGEEALRRITDFDPTVRAIVSSGYSNNHIMARFEDYGFRGVLKKPYKIEDLKNELSRVIHGI
jgi:CheY-like chemotaxis protein